MKLTVDAKVTEGNKLFNFIDHWTRYHIEKNILDQLYSLGLVGQLVIAKENSEFITNYIGQVRSG